MKQMIFAAVLLIAGSLTTKSQIMENPNLNTSLAPVEQLTLTQEWDKVFPKSDKVDHKKVTFVNRYGITLAADMYIPKGANGKLPAIAVSGPFGAVKEQSSGLYAQQLAERGFLTIAFDPSFTGESGGEPRRVASPDINVEDFSAAVDFLSVQPEV
ncbi:MAG: alpha/beta hydrolase, partial [Muribaculaceae bacterium]|nr:alpha/beta hydrolase [Muribaculaceae bacterium]